MFKKMLPLTSLLLFSISCASMKGADAERSVANDGSGRRRGGVDFGEYTSQVVRSSTGQIDVSQEFARFRGLEGKNLKGILIEAVALPALPSRDRRDRGTPVFREISVLLGRRPVERIPLSEYSGRQFVYVDLDRQVGDTLELLEIQYDPQFTKVRNLTILTNDQEPWRVPRTQMGVIFRNSATGKYYFGKGDNEIDAEFEAKSQCQKDGYSTNCGVYKKAALTMGQSDFACTIRNTATSLSFLGKAKAQLEAEAMALISCQNGGYTTNCSGDLTCSNGGSNFNVSGCLMRNTATGKTFFGKAISDVEATFLAKQSCQVSGYPHNCTLQRCESGDERSLNSTCMITNSATGMTFRGSAKLKIEAEALARAACEAAGYPHNCVKDFRCSN